MKSKFLSKKLLVWLLAVMMIVASMTGCGGKEDDGEDKDSKSKNEQSVEDEEDEEESKEDEEESKEDEEESKEDEEESKEDEAEESKDDEEEESKDDEEESKEEDSSNEDVKEDEVVKENTEEAYNVVTQMVEACQGKVMTKSTMDMELEMSIGIEGTYIDMDMAMSGDTYASAEPYMSYSELTLTMNVMGQNMVETTKSYMVLEDGNMVTYSYMESEDQWMKESVAIDEEALMNQQNTSYQFLLDKAAEDYALDSELYNINGRDAYKLSFVLTGDELQNSLNGMANMEDLMAEADMEDFDMSALSVPTVYYVDAENYYVVGMEMSIEGMDEMIGDMMDELMAAEGEEYSMSFELGKCNMIFSNISYDPVEIPAIPDEALDA